MRASTAQWQHRFAEALARRDVQSRMDEFYAAELTNLPPEAA
jgi:hypothetical protein